MIEIVSRQKIAVEQGVIERWQCDLYITQDGVTLYLPEAAPGELQESELQGYFEGIEDQLWATAQGKQCPADIFENVIARRALKAFVSVAMDEINILRAEHGLPARTKEQLARAIKDKLKE